MGSKSSWYDPSPGEKLAIGAPGGGSSAAIAAIATSAAAAQSTADTGVAAAATAQATANAAVPIAVATGLTNTSFLPDDDAIVVSRTCQVSKSQLPWNGSAVVGSTGLGQPIWSDSANTWIVEACTIGGRQQVRAARLDTSTLLATQDVMVSAVTHDSLSGHRTTSIATSDTGTVVTHSEVHAGPWKGFNSTVARNLTTLTPTPTPVGSDLASSYRRFYRNPYTGELWMVQRGNNYQARIYVWNIATNVWDIRGDNPVTATGYGAYGCEIAFAPGGIVYVATEFRNLADGLSGYPRTDIGLAISRDNGVTYSNLAGVPITGGISPLNITVLFPGVPGATGGARYNGAVVKVGIMADGRPLVVAEWRHPTLDGAFRSLWSATVSSAGFIRRRRILKSVVDWDCGNATLAYRSDGLIYISVSQRDDHLPLSADPGNSEVNSTNYPDSPYYLFTTTDGDKFSRYTLDSGTNGLGVSGGYLDPESVRFNSSKVRIKPVFSLQPTNAEVWSVALPAALPTTSESNTGTPSGRPATPSTATQPSLWLRPEELTGTTGAAIPTWVANVGTSAVEPVAGVGPKVLERAINAKRCARFLAANNQRMTIAQPLKAQNLTVISVVSFPTISGSGVTVFSTDTGAGVRSGNSPHVYFDNAGCHVTIYGVGTASIAGGALYPSTWQICVASFAGADAAAHAVTAYLNGTKGGVGTSAAITTGAAPLMAIGGIGTAIATTIDIAEMIRFDAVLSDADVASWVAYLRSTHGLI